MNWLDKMERKYGRYAIPNLMYYVIVLDIAGFVIYYIAPQVYDYLPLSMNAVMQGQVWRLVSFVLIPPATDVISMVFFVLFYYWLGNALEQIWGSFRFNVYLFSGVLLHIIAALVAYFIFGVDLMMNLAYLNISLFLAFGTEFPDYEIYLMFVFRVKMKYLAVISGVFLGIQIIGGIVPALLGQNVGADTLSGSVAALIAIGNFLIYLFNNQRVMPRRSKTQKQMRKAVQKSKNQTKVSGHHKCAICGRTDIDYPELEFRYCSKCEGGYEYCIDHLYTHVHVTKHGS